MLKKKSNVHVLEPLDTRMLRVREFCQRFKPSLEYDIVPINDIYGPTAWDSNIQALVLSDETREGAAAGMSSVSVNMATIALIIVFISGEVTGRAQPFVTRTICDRCNFIVKHQVGS